MAFNTNNPLGSTDPRDLSDNAENFDDAVNNLSSATWTDRFGNTRTSLAGQVGYIGTGVDGAIESYTSGLTLTTYSTIIEYNGEFYRPASGSIPYTTTATTPDADANLVPVGDATLRQDLAQDPATAGNGVLLVNGAVIRVSSRTEMKGYDVPAGYQFSLEEGGRSGLFVRRAGTPPVTDTQEGWYVVADSGGYDERVDKYPVLVEHFGADPSLLDNTAAYNGLISVAPEGSRILWGSPGETYIGNFWSEDKSLRCDLNGAILEDFTNDPLIAIGSLTDVTEYDVIETELNYGDTAFDITGADSLFSVGDIGYLWDQAVRPTGGDVNFETVKIKALSGDTVTVDGFLASYKGAAGIKFYHRSTQLKGSEIKNGTLAPSDSHTFIVSGCFNVDGVLEENLQTTNTHGVAVSNRFCWNVTGKNIKPEKPRDTGSGNGYGFQVRGCSHFHISDIRGTSCRHALDGDSVYFGEVWDVSDPDAQSAPVDIGHNGFVGHVSIEGVDVVTDIYPVVVSASGYGGSPSADADKHPIRKLKVRRVKSRVPTKTVNDDNVSGVYIQNNVEDFLADDISANYVDGTAVSASAGSHLVRINGIVTSGICSITNLSANRVGTALFLVDEGEGTYGSSNVKVDGVALGECRYAIRTQGRQSLAFDNIALESAPVSGTAVFMQDNASGDPVAVFAGNTLELDTGDTVVVDSEVSGIKGKIPLYAYSVSSGVSVSSGSSITRSEVQNKSQYLRVVPPVGSGTTTLSATTALPPSIVDNEELYIAQPSSGRDSVEFPAGDNIIGGFTIGQEESVRLIGDTGKWRLVGRFSVA